MIKLRERAQRVVKPKGRSAPEDRIAAESDFGRTFGEDALDRVRSFQRHVELDKPMEGALTAEEFAEKYPER